MNIKPATLLTAIGMLALSSCTATEKAALPIAVTTTTTSVPGAEISVDPQTPPALPSDLSGEELLVALEARWMCDVQRFAFPDLNAMNEALDGRLASHGLQRTDYDEFKAEMENRIDLREQVLVGYDEYCGED